MRTLLALMISGAALAADRPFDPLPVLDLSKLKPSDFTDAELDLPYYLAHFREFAGAVVEEGPERGFIGISVWRAPNDNKPFNARIMENILSLTYFYTTKRPWNIYYGSKPVRQRLEAALEFWLRSQSPDGRFSEYGPGQWNLAATAFATKFMGRTLMLLQNAPPIDPALLKRVVEADRKAIRIVLTDAGLWKHGLTYTNQYTNIWAGGLELLHIAPDANLEALFWKRVEDGIREFQSPAGYFYEADGPDFGYSSNTSQHNLEVVYQFTRGTPRSDAFIEHEKRWFEWVQYNALPEPDGGWILNRAIETRQRHARFDDVTTPLAERIPLARAFAVSKTEQQAQVEKERAKLTRDWPKVAPLKIGEFSAFSPYAFLHRDQFEWYPTAVEQNQARRVLPYNAKTRFIHQRADSRNPVVSTYVQRPLYYAAFNSGKVIREQQRYGLGLVWVPKLGGVLQSQTGSAHEAWGTESQGQSGVSEASVVNAEFEVAGERVLSEPGFRDLRDGDLMVRYPIAGGEKTVRFLDDRIIVNVRQAGAISEIVPLLEDSAIHVGEGVVRIAPQFEVRLNASIQSSAIEHTSTKVGRKRVVVLRLRGENELNYTLAFAAAWVQQ